MSFTALKKEFHNYNDIGFFSNRFFENITNIKFRKQFYYYD